MATLASIEKEIAKLMKEKEALLQKEVKAAVQQALGLIEQFGLTAADLGFGKKTRAVKAGGGLAAKRAAKAAGAPKYRDPATGKTWTGHGKPPNWLAGAKDRGQFLIADVTVAGPDAATAPGVKAPAKKVARKAAVAPKGGRGKKAVVAAAASDATGNALVKKGAGRASAKKSTKSAQTPATVNPAGTAAPQAA